MRANRKLVGLAAAALIASGTGAAWAESIPEAVQRLKGEVEQLKQSIATSGSSAALAARVADLEKRVNELASRSSTGNSGPGGNDKVHINDGWISFYNQSAKQVVAVGRADTNVGVVQTSDKNGTRSSELGSDTGGGYLTMWTQPGKLQALTLRATEKRGGYLDITNGNGKYVVSLGAGNEQGGYSRYYNSQGRETVYVGTCNDDRGCILVEGKKIGDYAEVFELATREGVRPGTVMAVVAEGGRIGPSTGAYDRRVVGVVSGAGAFAPGMILGVRDDGSKDFPIAINGQVYVRVTDENGAVAPGDLLVASSTPGVAMRAGDGDRAMGAVLGKALDAHKERGEGLVHMLVMAR
ncbi:MAG TPA: hypothetical protein VMV26_10835 [Alphaproteobacteria bacterium]|jgi:hypothetical protein|nr:hypothetical protein [Alphaproteobacteria bacterium]